MDKKEIVARIDELMIEKGISKYKLKENADVSTTIYQWKKNAARDKWRVPSLRSIEKICNYLGVSLSYFFSLTKSEQREIKNRELVDLICKLPDEQIAIIESLIKELIKTPH